MTKHIIKVLQMMCLVLIYFLISSCAYMDDSFDDVYDDYDEYNLIQK